jgi:hypothetical protein
MKNNYIMRKFVICTFHQILYFYDEKIRIVIMDRTCSMPTLLESGNLEGRPLGYLESAEPPKNYCLPNLSTSILQ